MNNPYCYVAKRANICVMCIDTSLHKQQIGLPDFPLYLCA